VTQPIDIAKQGIKDAANQAVDAPKDATGQVIDVSKQGAKDAGSQVVDTGKDTANQVAEASKNKVDQVGGDAKDKVAAGQNAATDVVTKTSKRKE
jgi:hypothetical protein